MIQTTDGMWNPENFTLEEGTGPRAPRRKTPESRPRDHSSLSLRLTAVSLLLAGQITRLFLLRRRGFDPDEFEHLHGAWSISKGLVPYRDFFEHHTPGFHFLLAPFFSLFQVETRMDHAIAFLFFSRTLVWVLAGAILWLTYELGRLWRGTRVGLIAAVLLAGTKIFLDKTLEIRPDVLSTVLWLGSLILALRAIRVCGRNGGEERCGSGRRRRLAWSGVLLGAGLMCTQKLILGCFGFTLGILGHAFERQARGARTARVRDLLAIPLGFAAPVSATLLYFAWRGGLGSFIDLNLALNLRWKATFDPVLVIRDFASNSPVVAVLGSVGLLTTLLTTLAGARLPWVRRTWARGPAEQGAQDAGSSPGSRSPSEDRFLFLCAIGPLAGLVVLPIVWPQYYLTFLPLVSLLGADLAVDIVDGISGRVSPRMPSIVRVQGCFLALLLAASSILPARQLKAAFASSNALDLAGIRYVMENTRPTDTVMDGWTGWGVFRPHAWFYFFPHGEVRAMLTKEQLHALLLDMRSGRIAPTLIILDSNLRELPPDILAYIRASYRPIGGQLVWRRLS